MRFTDERNTIQRHIGNRRSNPHAYHPHIPRPISTPKVESEDTKTRKDIYKTIVEMMNEGKGDIAIEVFLTNKYPNYAEYIPKVISDQFAKRNLNKKEKTEIADDGER